MASSMLKKEEKIFSEKYDVHGVIRDYSVVTKLLFNYQDRELVIAVKRYTIKGESLEEIGIKVLESYIENLAPKEPQTLRLHDWYIEAKDDGDKTYAIGHGIVSGHRRVPDATKMRTSPVKAIEIDRNAGELLLTTENSRYHCPLEYCRFKKQDKYPEAIPDYEDIKAACKDKIVYPSIEPGKVLLVLSNHCAYYFHSLYYVPDNSKNRKPLDYAGYSHIGTFQDSYLVNTDDQTIDLRYFPHFQNISFYEEETSGCPLYLENVGDVVLYAKTFEGMLRLEPGERKEVRSENALKATPVLPNGDLYPAGIIE